MIFTKICWIFFT